MEDQAAGGAADREVEDADRLGTTLEVPERARQVRDRGWTRSPKMSDSWPAPQPALDGERLVADCVAVGERREELVDLTAPARAGRPAGRFPAASEGTLPGHVLERLRAPRERLDASRELQVAVLELLHLEVQSGQLEHQVVQQAGP